MSTNSFAAIADKVSNLVSKMDPSVPFVEVEGLPVSGLPATVVDAVNAEAMLVAATKRLTSIILSMDASGQVPTEGFGPLLKSIAASLVAIADAKVDGETLRALPVGKAELDAYTAVITTLNAAGDRSWELRSLFKDGKLDEFNANVDQLVAMYQSVKTAASGAGVPATTDDVSGVEMAAKSEDGTTTITMTVPEFTAWSVDQFQKAAADPDADEAHARIVHLAQAAQVAKALNFEDTGGAPQVITMTMATAYAPLASQGMGTPLDLTTKGDQQVTEMPAATAVTTPQATIFSQNLEKAAAIAKGFSVSATLPGKAEKQTAGAYWPMDMNMIKEPPAEGKAWEEEYKRDLTWGTDPTGLKSL